MPPVWSLFIHGAALAGVAALMGLAIAIDVAPLTGTAGAWPMPDLLFLITACIALRRPGWVPAPQVLAAGLLRDLLAGGAVGPAALGLLVASLRLRNRAPHLRRRSFAVEWLTVMAMAIVAMAVPVLLLGLTLSDLPESGALAQRLAVTALAYPLVVALTRVGRDRALRADDRRGEAPA